MTGRVVSGEGVCCTPRDLELNILASFPHKIIEFLHHVFNYVRIKYIDLTVDKFMDDFF